MKRIIKQDLSITLAVLAIAIFAFFFWMYPYHLFHKEQMMLFLYSGEFLRGYFQEEAWLAVSPAISSRNSFYYIGGGPVHPKRCLNFICPAYLSDIPAIRQQEIRPSSYDTTCIMGGRKVLRTRLSVIRDSLLDRSRRCFPVI